MDWFCQYKFGLQLKQYKKISFENFKKVLLKEISDNDDKFESIIGNQLYINQFNLQNLLKGFYFNDKKPSLFFNKNKRT